MHGNCLTVGINGISKVPGALGALMAAFMLSSVPDLRADVPDAVSGAFGGLYKVTSSTDPIFPATRTNEYFLDFGKGFRSGNPSGRVAVSIRQNPKVSVRIMSWQYFPEQGRILIGTPSDDGSRRAVARGAWSMRGVANGVIFQRGNYQVILQRADPNDY